MTSEDTTTSNVGLNLPGIGVRTNWATQYRENFQQLDAIFAGNEVVPAIAANEIGGSLVGDHPEGQDTITDFVGSGLFVDSSGTLNAFETTGTPEVIAQTRRRLNTPVGGA